MLKVRHVIVDPFHTPLKILSYLVQSKLIHHRIIGPEIWHIFRHVTRRFRDEVSEMLHHLEPHGVEREYLRIIHRIPQSRIRILPLPFKPHEPSEVVDARDPRRHIIARRTDVVRQILRRPLDAVTKPDRRARPLPT